MQRFKKWALGLLLVLLGMEILTIAPKKVNNANEAKVAEPTPTVIPKSSVATMSQTMHGVHLVETGLGKKEWELDAANAQGFKDKGTWKLQGVHVKFFGSNDSTYNVTGDYGTIETETKDMEITGNVVTTTSEGYVVKTSSVNYQAKKRSLTTTAHVDIVGPKNRDGQFQLSGTGLDANLDTNVMFLKQSVRAVKSVPPARLMTINSNWAKIYGKTSEAHFAEDVQVDIDNVRMTGNQADFVYEKNQHALKELVMQDNVRVTDQTHWASARKARVLFAENEFILLGDPRVTQQDNELRGEEIRFLDGGKEVQVIKARARVDNEKQLPLSKKSQGPL
jgi:LPS export ABC transporter protein LptC